jgi:hypothetical protein
MQRPACAIGGDIEAATDFLLVTAVAQVEME